MSKLFIMLSVLMLNGCMGVHAYVGGDKKLEGKVIVLRMGDLSATQRCSKRATPSMAYSLYATKPLSDFHKNLPEEYWTTDRPKNVGRERKLPLVKNYENKIEFAACEICSVADKNIVWEEMMSRCSGATQLIPQLF